MAAWQNQGGNDSYGILKHCTKENNHLTIFLYVWCTGVYERVPGAAFGERQRWGQASSCHDHSSPPSNLLCQVRDHEENCKCFVFFLKILENVCALGLGLIRCFQYFWPGSISSRFVLVLSPSRSTYEGTSNASGLWSSARQRWCCSGTDEGRWPALGLGSLERRRRR